MSQLQYLKGVGPARVKQLAKLGLFSVEDLVHYYPRDYHVRKMVAIRDLPQYTQTVIVQGVVQGVALTSRGRKAYVKAPLTDGTGLVNCTWFNQAYLANKLTPGLKVTVTGKYNPQYRNFTVEEFSLEGELNTIQPVYALTDGLSNSVLGRIINNALADYHEPDFPQEFSSQYKLLPVLEALREAHNPRDDQLLKKAIYTLKFRELFLYQLSFLYWRRMKEQAKGVPLKSHEYLKDKLQQALGFQFTQDQVTAIAEIERDLITELPMNRMLQGDVGSGKTAVAAFPLLMAALNGFKGVLMAPTEILARQHFATISKVSNAFEIHVSILTGASKSQERKMVNDALVSPGGHILVGTHALFQDKLSFRDLAVVITDEQHRFGVGQRLSLVGKGENPHVLAMSATPIPRTMAMTVYGDLDVSSLRTKPGGRKDIKTYVIDSSKRQRMFNFLVKEMTQGNVGYIVCPLIEESEKLSALSLQEYEEVLKEGLPSWCKVGKLHGKMAAQDKEGVINDLKAGKINILLSTTVVEVGVDVGNATFIVVENAERFGLAQLHQLRGRVGRRDQQGWCILVTDGPETKRLKILEQVSDGYALSLEDMKIRGTGQFLGSRQHGLNEFKIANILTDTEISRTSWIAAGKTLEILAENHWQWVREIVQTKIEHLKS